MAYSLMNIIGPALLIAALIWGYFYYKGRSRRVDRASDEGTRRLREELNAEDTGQKARQETSVVENRP
jgi:hypothetical protein